MPIKAHARRYSKKLIFNLLVMAMLSWLLLLGSALILWVHLGFEQAYQRLYKLSQKQRSALIKFDDLKIVKKISAWVPAADSLTRKVAAINHAFYRALPQSPLNDNNPLQQIIADTWLVSQEIWMLMSMTTQVMLIKLMLLLTAIPLFCLSMTAGLVDGLNQRAIRTASLGRESSYVFHQLNRYFKHGLVLLLGIWLVMPLNIAPAMLLVPVSVLLSIMVSATASRFKKYI